MGTVEERLEILERANRRYRRLLLCGCAASLAWVGMGAVPLVSVPDVVRAKRFEVLDTGGRRIVELGSVGAAGAVTTYDKNGRALVLLAGEYGPNGHHGSITTSDSKGRRIVTIGVTESERGVVGVFNEQGHNVAWLGVNEAGHGAMGVSRSDGGELVAVGGTPESQGALMMFDGSGRKLIELGGMGAEAAGLNLFGGQGLRMVTLKAAVGGGSLLVGNNAAGPSCALRADNEGNGQILVFDHEGKARGFGTQQ